jgi:hypothetical protein
VTRFAARSALLLTLSSGTAAADPQFNTGFLAGVAGRGVDDAVWDDTCFYGGLRGDVILGRNAPRDFGAGPYLNVATACFDDARFGGGVTLHLPVHETFPLLLSAGPLLRAGPSTDVGGSVQLFFGPRSYNYHGAYSLAGGLVVGAERTFGNAPETLLIIAAQVDTMVLILPIMLGYQALRGGAD